MTRNALLLVVALGALRDPCGTDTSPADLNAACTRDKDCAGGLTCTSGVCSLPDAGAPDGGGTNEGAAGDDGSAAE